MTNKPDVELWVAAIADLIRPLDHHDFLARELRDYAMEAEGLLCEMIRGMKNNHQLSELLEKIADRTKDLKVALAVA